MQEKTPGKGDSQVQSYGRGKRAREVFIEVDGDYPFVFIYSGDSADSPFRIIIVIQVIFFLHILRCLSTTGAVI